MFYCFRSFAKLSVSAERKWTDIFRHCHEWLGAENGKLVDSAKVVEHSCNCDCKWKEVCPRKQVNTSQKELKLHVTTRVDLV